MVEIWRAVLQHLPTEHHWYFMINIPEERPLSRQFIQNYKLEALKNILGEGGVDSDSE